MAMSVCAHEHRETAHMWICKCALCIRTHLLASETEITYPKYVLSIFPLTKAG